MKAPKPQIISLTSGAIGFSSGQFSLPSGEGVFASELLDLRLGEVGAFTRFGFEDVHLELIRWMQL